MAAHSGVKLFGESKLLFAMDSKSPKSRQTDLNILSDWVEGWTAGTTGSSTGFGQNGDGNSRLLDTNPYGATATVWDVSNQDATSDADGGWNSSTFDIDNTKMYRFSTWVRRKTIGNGSFYLGTYGRNSGSSNIGVYNRSNGANNTNPYFSSRGWWGSANTWYLVVGHIWPAGSGTGSTHPDSGIYTVDGTKVTTVGDFVWRPDNFKSTHRSYLYYSTNTSTNQQWWNPRVEIVDTPSISIKSRTAVPVQRLIKEGIGGRWNIRNKATEAPGVVGLRKVKRSSTGFVFSGNDDDQSVRIPLAGNFNKLEGTISCWVYPTSYSGSNGIFVNRDDPTANATDWLWAGMWSSGSVFYFRIGQSGSCCSNDLTFSSASSSIPLNTWTHVTCSWKSAGTSAIYINGALKTSRSISAIPSTSPSTHGRIGLGHDSGATGAWNGRIDQFKIYQTQLSATDILRNYQATRGRYI
jgi:hypothetical protein